MRIVMALAAAIFLYFTWGVWSIASVCFWIAAAGFMSISVIMLQRREPEYAALDFGASIILTARALLPHTALWVSLSLLVSGMVIMAIAAIILMRKRWRLAEVSGVSMN